MRKMKFNNIKIISYLSLIIISTISIYYSTRKSVAITTFFCLILTSTCIKLLLLQKNNKLKMVEE